MRLNLKPTMVIFVATALLGGCAADDRSSYVEPTLNDNQVATVSGGWGYYISEVDGCRVDSANITIDYGGNSVKVTPGEHEFIAHLSMSSPAPTAGGAYATSGINDRRTWQYNYTVEAGHHYQIAATSLLNTDPTITDKQTKHTEAIQTSTEAIQTPEQQKRDAITYPGD
jgi:hypothetical protein